MELNKENMRKIRELILFTALLIVVLWKYEEVLEVLGYVGHLIFPFLLGGAIALVLNVPDRASRTRWRWPSLMRLKSRPASASAPTRASAAWTWRLSSAERTPSRPV